MSRITQEDLEAMLENEGEKERLKELLRQRLKESGWTREVQERCKAVVEEKGGIESLSVGDLVDTVTPFARKQVPKEVKTELMELIRSFLVTKSGISDF